MDAESGDIKNVIVIGLIKGTGRRKGQFLFVKEPDGAILFPGGKVKVTESLTDALYREIKEETGLECTGRRLVCIEHVGSWEKGALRASRSMLLYFYEVNIVQKMHTPNEGGLWMERKQIEAAKAVVPYDNLLMARGLASVELGRPYVVPPGFQDTPGDPNSVAVRTFCWASEKA
jgi:ADP-ribose pyrophosphatase YjhB (NUDIX family)